MQRSDTHALPNYQTRLNPVAALRLKMGLTQDQLATRTHYSMIYVQHLEFGILPNISPAVITFLGDENLPKKYDEWISSTRRVNRIHLDDPVARFIDVSSDLYGNWNLLRLSVSDSKTGFCKLYCIHPNILYGFEKKWSRVDKLSKGIRDIFLDCGIGKDTLRDMDLALRSRRVT